MVPSSPKVPCSTGKITSTLMARSLARRVSVRIGLKGTSAALPVHRLRRHDHRFSPGQHSRGLSWFPDRRRADWRGSRISLPCSRFSASPAVSQRPSFVMPMGTTSYLSLSIALRTDAAESRETSCSPLRPPNRIPTRSLFISAIESSSQTQTAPTPPPGPRSGCARRSRDSLRRSRNLPCVRGRR